MGGGAGPWKVPLGRRGWGSVSMWPGGTRKRGHRPQRTRRLGRGQGSLGAAPRALPLQVQPPRSLPRGPSAPTCGPQPWPAMGPGPRPAPLLSAGLGKNVAGERAPTQVDWSRMLRDLGC